MRGFAHVPELRNLADLAQMLGPHWWFHFSDASSEVVMPPEFYRSENLETSDGTISV
jgi:hypothetical protein